MTKSIHLNKIITMEAGRRQSRPCVRGLRITVQDVLGWLDAGMGIKEIIEDFPEINKRDIEACIQYAQDASNKHLAFQLKK